MAFEEGLFTYLSTYPGLAALIGTRLYPLLLPQQVTFPAVTYQRISTVRLLEFEQSFMPHPRFQFSCWAESFPDSRDVAAQIFLALDIYQGAMGLYTVRVSIVDGNRDVYDPVTGIWNSIVDVVIWYVG